MSGDFGDWNQDPVKDAQSKSEYVDKQRKVKVQTLVKLLFVLAFILFIILRWLGVLK